MLDALRSAAILHDHFKPDLTIKDVEHALCNEKRFWFAGAASIAGGRQRHMRRTAKLKTLFVMPMSP